MLQIPLYDIHNQLELLVTQKLSLTKCNIFYICIVIISHEVVSGNITVAISDHIPQFLFAPNVLSMDSCRNSNIYERDWPKFNQTDFALDYFNKNWSDVLQLDQQNVNLPTESSLGNILDEHAPLKRINKYKVKFKSKL